MFRKAICGKLVLVGGPRKLAAPSSESEGTKHKLNGSECPFFAIK
jgi:hypothetical protein